MATTKKEPHQHFKNQNGCLIITETFLLNKKKKGGEIPPVLIINSSTQTKCPRRLELIGLRCNEIGKGQEEDTGETHEADHTGAKKKERRKCEKEKRL